ncbi:hypothetical protein RLEG3_02165 (plasmid) [Rhizobium leguminosarum bv. trifolii WSM1689]|nr:hypothetical protein RLEG3_02165 [Rhizobium leguminosarum bv. trifolii WSM1689]
MEVLSRFGTLQFMSLADSVLIMRLCDGDDLSARDP